MKEGYKLFLNYESFSQLEPPIFKKRNGKEIERPDQIERLYNSSRQRVNGSREEIYCSFKKYILNDGAVDGDEILRDYFPMVKADVFISHSHNDLKLALAFSQWLLENFNIHAFVDYNIWGNGDELIRVLDNKYSLKKNNAHYDYKTRNLTTSFVHLMLASAISKMIDSCECLFFLNSPNSLSADPSANTTGSPWIFYELLMAKLLQEKKPEVKSFSHGGTMDGRISFIVKNTPPISNLKTFSLSTLKRWKQLASGKSARQSLDILYGLS